MVHWSDSIYLFVFWQETWKTHKVGSAVASFFSPQGGGELSQQLSPRTIQCFFFQQPPTTKSHIHTEYVWKDSLITLGHWFYTSKYDGIQLQDSQNLNGQNSQVPNFKGHSKGWIKLIHPGWHRHPFLKTEARWCDTIFGGSARWHQICILLHIFLSFWGCKIEISQDNLFAIYEYVSWSI